MRKILIAPAAALFALVVLALPRAEASPFHAKTMSPWHSPVIAYRVEGCPDYVARWFEAAAAGIDAAVPSISLRPGRIGDVRIRCGDWNWRVRELVIGGARFREVRVRTPQGPVANPLPGVIDTLGWALGFRPYGTFGPRQGRKFEPPPAAAWPAVADLYRPVLRRWVNGLYLRYLARPGDAEGLDWWVAEIAAGRATHAATLAAFAAAGERLERSGG